MGFSQYLEAYHFWLAKTFPFQAFFFFLTNSKSSVWFLFYKKLSLKYIMNAPTVPQDLCPCFPLGHDEDVSQSRPYAGW